MKIQPITRKERFLNEIVGWGETAPKNELTTEELFFAKILGRNVTLPDLSNVPRYYLLLAKIAGENVNVTPPTYVSPPLEFFLAKAAGMDVEAPAPRTREEIFWAAYAGIEVEIEGVPPLMFKSNGANLSNYRIYGNTVNGESVGDLVENGEHAGEYLVPVTVNSVTTNLYFSEQIRKIGNAIDWVDYQKKIFHKKTAKATLTGQENWAADANGIYRSAFYTPTPYENFYAHGYQAVSNYGALLATDKSIVIGTTAIVIHNDDYQGETKEQGLELFKAHLSGNPITVLHEVTAVNNPIEIPALSTFTGTNTLSVETTVQPSKVVVNGKTGGAS